MKTYRSNFEKYKVEKPDIVHDKLESLKVRCKCGHTMSIAAYLDYRICNFCGSKVINNTKEHFKYKLLKELRKNETKN